LAQSAGLPSRGGIKLSTIDLVWIVVGALIPILLAILHYVQVPGPDAQLLVTASLILGAFSLHTTRLRAIERSIESLQGDSNRRTNASNELATAALTGDEMKECRRLLAAYRAVVDFDNPLMTALAKTQMSGLGEFLEKFDKGLPFFPENELITIEKHYLSFMKRMGRRGKYDATTFVQFWHDQDEEILHDFFHNNEVAANDGVAIRRVFLISPSDEGTEMTEKILRRHARISTDSYQSGGSISTRVLRAEGFSHDQDDFGIYMLDNVPMAIAIAKFNRNTGRLRGNEVSFDDDFMRKRRQLFESRWANAVEIHSYLITRDRTLSEHGEA
jgi:hypothetical protein